MTDQAITLSLQNCCSKLALSSTVSKMLYELLLYVLSLTFGQYGSQIVYYDQNVRCKILLNVFTNQ